MELCYIPAPTPPPTHQTLHFDPLRPLPPLCPRLLLYLEEGCFSSTGNGPTFSFLFPTRTSGTNHPLGLFQRSLGSSRSTAGRRQEQEELYGQGEGGGLIQWTSSEGKRTLTCFPSGVRAGGGEHVIPLLARLLGLQYHSDQDGRQDKVP